jgi:hypothetical protein
VSGREGDDGADDTRHDDAGTLPDGTRAADDRERDAGSAVISSDGGCSNVSAKSELKRLPIDIVWAIDSSSSMGGEQQRVRENLTRFASAFTTMDIDAHVVLVNKCDIAGDTTLAGSANYTYISETISSRNALDKLLKSFDRWQGQLRAGAPTHFIVVSDDDSSMKPDDFRMQMEAKLGHPFTLHAIASEDVGDGEPCVATSNCSDAEGACGGFASLTPCKASQPGLVYYALAAQTGGESISICQSDWASVFTRLETALVASSALPCHYNLPEPPAGKKLETKLVRIDYSPTGQAAQSFPRANEAASCRGERGWYYDVPEKPSEILLCPAACDAAKAGGALDIALVCSEDQVPVILL